MLKTMLLVIALACPAFMPSPKPAPPQGHCYAASFVWSLPATVLLRKQRDYVDTDGFVIRFIPPASDHYECHVETLSGDLERPEQLIPCAWKMANKIFWAHTGLDGSQYTAPAVGFYPRWWYSFDGTHVCGEAYTNDWLVYIDTEAQWNIAGILIHEFLHCLVARVGRPERISVDDEWIQSGKWMRGY